MKNSEIRCCDVCGNGLSGGSPLAGATITVQRHVINPQNARALAGLQMMFGAGMLADTFAPGNAVESPSELRSEVLVCNECVLPVLGLIEQAEKKGGAA